MDGSRKRKEFPNKENKLPGENAATAFAPAMLSSGRIDVP